MFLMSYADSNSIVTARSREKVKITAVKLAVSNYVKCCCDVDSICKEPRTAQGYLLTWTLFSLCQTADKSRATLLVDNIAGQNLFV